MKYPLPTRQSMLRKIPPDLRYAYRNGKLIDTLDFDAVFGKEKMDKIRNSAPACRIRMRRYCRHAYILSRAIKIKTLAAD